MLVERMDTVKVSGKNAKHKVFVYAISTCAWCKMTKKFLKTNDVEYEYVDVDLCNEKEKDKIYRDIQKRGGRPSFPAIIIDDKILINGFHEDKVREALEI